MNEVWQTDSTLRRAKGERSRPPTADKISIEILYFRCTDGIVSGVAPCRCRRDCSELLTGSVVCAFHKFAPSHRVSTSHCALEIGHNQAKRRTQCERGNNMLLWIKVRSSVCALCDLCCLSRSCNIKHNKDKTVVAAFFPIGFIECAALNVELNRMRVTELCFWACIETATAATKKKNTLP